MPALTTDATSALIVTSTIERAHGLGLTVVAEGIEDVHTLEALRVQDCDLVQGYLLGRPVPAGELDLRPAPDLAASRARP